MKLIRKYLLILFGLSVSFGQTNIISIPDTIMVGGDSTWISIDISNTDEIAGFQFDLIYPDEIIYLDSFVVGNRFVDHATEVEYLDTYLRVLVYSASLTSITGNSGEVLSLFYGTEPVLGEYDLIFNNPVLANANYENVITTSENGTIILNTPAPQFSTFSLFEFIEDSILVITRDSLEAHITDINTPIDQIIFSLQSDSLIVMQSGNDYLITASENWFGSDTITIIASDGIYSDTSTIPVNVIPVNDPPTPPNLISPINGWTADFVLITFEWSTPTDVEDDSLNMMLYFNSLNTLDSLSIADNDTTITIYQFNFPINEPIQWWIEVSDGELSTVSDSFTFIIPDGLYHDGPVWHVATDGSDENGDGSFALPYAKIQTAIDSANVGDTVFVHPGTYVENINYNGNNIVVGSLYMTTQDTSYISSTVIDGNQNGSVVNFESGEDSTAVLSGFTITNGMAPYPNNGGGIYCVNSSPYLSNIIIKENTCNNNGGGIYFSNSSSILVNSKIINNGWGNYRPYEGGGLSIVNSVLNLINCQINDNLAALEGGGIWVSNSNVFIQDSEINDNLLNTTSSTTTKGAGIYSNNSSVLTVLNSQISNNNCGSGLSGGICCDNTSLTITNSLISNNESGHGPSGLYMFGSLLMENTKIIENTSYNGGAIKLDGNGSVLIKSSLIADNLNTDISGTQTGIFLQNSVPILINTTITNNSGVSIFINGGSDPIITNCIVWNDNGDEITITSSGDPIITYTCIDGDWGGTGNIDTNPLFTDASNGDYTIQSTSPCIDTGDPDLDDDGEDYTTDTDDQDPDGSRMDMGAYPRLVYGNINSPIIISVSHQQGIWTSDDAPTFTLSAVTGATGYKYLFDQDSLSAPNYYYGTEINNSTISFEDVNDGIWYLHVRSIDSDGLIGAEISHFQINIDTYVSPIAITSETHPDESTVYPHTTLSATWLAEDGLSGISEVQSAFDNLPSTDPSEVVDNDTLTFYNLIDGTHYLHMQAVDNAGNESDIVHYSVNINTPPSVVINGPMAGSSFDQDVNISYTISDVLMDTVDLLLNYSIDHGNNWLPITSITGQISDIDSVFYSSDVVWHSYNEIPNFESDSVLISIIPSDFVSSGGRAISGYFHLDNNDPPTTEIIGLSGEISGTIPFSLEQYDSEDDEVTYLIDYSTDEQQTWSPATLNTGRDVRSGRVTVSRQDTMELNWLTETDIPDEDAQSVYLRAILVDNDPGPPAITDALNVDNYHGHSIELPEITEEQQLNITINYVIQDSSADELTLYFQSSINGGQNWTNIGTLHSVNPNQYDGTLNWDSYSTFPGIDQSDVLIKVSIFDQWQEGDGDEITITLDNNLPPVASLSTGYIELAGDKIFEIGYTDTENDSILWEYFYSIDFGQIWNTANVVVDTVNITWLSLENIPNYESDSILFKVTPFDNDEGESAITEYFAVDNDHSISEILLESGEYSSVITIPYVLQDMGADPLDLTLEYFYNSSWNVASTLGNISDITDYNDTIRWNSQNDLNNLDIEDLQIRLTATDEWAIGQSDTINIHLDNEVGPQLVSFTNTVGLRAPIHLEFSLPISEAVYSDYFNIISDIDGSINDKIAYERLSDHRFIQINLIPGQSFTSMDSLTLTIMNTLTDTLGKGFDGDGDGDPEYSSEDDITLDIVTHLLGDYDTTGVIDIYDLNQFVSAWYAKDYFYELGPATGTVPHLIPTYDEQYNIEDLATFFRMWNWSYSFSQPLTKELVTDGLPSSFGFEDSRLIMTLPETDEIISAMRVSISCLNADVEINSNLEDEFTFALVRNWKDVAIKELNLARTNLNDSLKTIVLGQVKGDRNLVYIDIRYEVLNPDGFVISRGYKTVEYVPLPSNFILYPAYPNPFNPVATIEFGLPVEKNASIIIYDITGREVARLINKSLPAGYHKVKWVARNQASGIYFVRMISGEFIKVQKIMLVK